MTNLLKHNIITVSPYLKSYPYTKTIWVKGHSDEFLRRLHSLSMINYLLLFYQKYYDDECIEKALAYFYLWHENNFPKSSCKLAYSDDVMALRLMTVSKLFCICKSLDLCILDDIFISVISHHLNILGKKTQGIKIQISVIIAATIYNHYFINNAYNTYIQSAMNNLRIQLDTLITDECFIIPSLNKAYQLFLALNQFYCFMTQYEKYQEFNKYLKTKSDILYDFIHAFTLPTGYLPPLFAEDTIYLNKKIILSYQNDLKRQYSYLFTNGKRGSSLLKKYYFFPKSNLLVVNNSTEITNNYYRLIFYNNHSNHHDNLAFVLYYKNSMLFVDYGKRYSGCYYHNTIAVDYHDYFINKNAGIVNIVNDDEFMFTCGIHTLYEEVILRRNLMCFFDRIIIIDEFISVENHDYEIIFNINKRVQLKTDRDKYIFGFMNDECYFMLNILYSTMELSTSYKNKQGNTLIYHGFGKDESVISQINLGSDEEVLINVDDSSFTLTINNDRYTILKGPIYNQLVRNEVSLPNQLNISKNLIKSIEEIYYQKRL